MARKLNRKNGFNDIFDQMQKMFNQMQNYGKELDFRSNIPVDIKEEDGKVVLTADMPGVQKEDISLRADKDSVEISAQTSQEIKEENEKYFRRERSSRSFRRTVAWPTEIDAESIKAKYEEGVLRLKADKVGENSGGNIEIE